jgi:hypothetical protein
MGVYATSYIYAADSNNFKVQRITASNGIMSNFAGTGTSGINGSLDSVHMVNPLQL